MAKMGFQVMQKAESESIFLQPPSTAPIICVLYLVSLGPVRSGRAHGHTQECGRDFSIAAHPTCLALCQELMLKEYA